MVISVLKGIVAASITPVTTVFRIDVDRLHIHIDHLLKSGCSFVSTFGTTGEGVSFSTGEKLRALHDLKAAGADMERQLPAIMTSSLSDAVESLITYSDLGCRAVLVVPPFYYGATEDGITGFFDALIAQTEARSRIDIVLYNIPQLSGIRFTPNLVAALVGKHGNRIAGIKDSTGDLENGLALLAAFPDLAVFTGDDRVLPALLKKGGAGMIGGMPNLFARDLKALYDNPEDGALLERQARRIEAVDAHGALVGLKAILAHNRGDQNLANVMPPLLALGQRDQAKLIELLEQTGYRVAA